MVLLIENGLEPRTLNIVFLLLLPGIVYSLLPVPPAISPTDLTVEINSKPEQECDHCQRVLYMSFVWYQRAESRRMLKHKIKHICKRYFAYRRHCLTTLLPKIDLIAERMAAARMAGHYKPIKTCRTLKECAKNQASLDPDEMRSLRSLAENITEIHDPNIQSVQPVQPIQVAEEVALRLINETLTT